MKRLLSFILSILMLFALVACGQTKANNVKTEHIQEESSSEVTEADSKNDKTKEKEKINVVSEMDIYKPVINSLIYYLSSGEKGSSEINDLFGEYYKNYNDDFYNAPEQFYNMRINTDLNPLEEVGYALMDLNNDGIKELLVGLADTNLNGPYENTSDYNFDNYVWLIYTIKDGKEKLIAESGLRYRHFIGNDGYIYYAGTGSASYSYVHKEIIKDSDLYIVEATFSYDHEYDAGYLYTECNCLEDEFDPENVETLMHNISLEDFNDKWDSMKDNVIVPDYTTLQDFYETSN